MSGPEKGNDVRLYVKLTSGTAVAIAGETGFSISRSADAVEYAAKDDDMTGVHASRQDVTCSCSALYVEHVSQARLLAQAQARGAVALELRRYDSSASAWVAFETADASMSSIELTFADKEVAQFSAEFDIDGDFVAVP